MIVTRDRTSSEVNPARFTDQGGIASAFGTKRGARDEQNLIFVVVHQILEFCFKFCQSQLSSNGAFKNGILKPHPETLPKNRATFRNQRVLAIADIVTDEIANPAHRVTNP